VVAYRQPVLRAEIEAVRGVQCGEVLRQLIERDLVRISGRSEELGRPLLYSTTRQFLQVFGLRHLEDLPRPEFLPITKLVTEDSADAVAVPPTPDLEFHHSRENQEETDMSVTIDKLAKPARIGTALAPQPERPIPAARTIYAAKAADEDEDEGDEDDLDDEPWEEVDDEDEDEDWEEEDDDEEWEEDEDLEEDDEDWDDDDDDWDDDDDEEGEDEKE
jgi:segregation and condensation protein B